MEVIGMHKKIISLSLVLAFAIVPLLPPTRASALVRSCSTGGASYLVDSMYVTMTYTTSGWRYYVDRSPDRTTFAPSGEKVYHRATLLSISDGMYLERINFPPKTFTYYSWSSKTVYFTINYSITSYYGTYWMTKSCTVGL